MAAAAARAPRARLYLSLHVAAAASVIQPAIIMHAAAAAIHQHAGRRSRPPPGPMATLATALTGVLAKGRQVRVVLLRALVEEGPAWVAYKLYDVLFTLLVLLVLRRFRWLDWLCDFLNWDQPRQKGAARPSPLGP